jgi:hypothetical protein
MTAIATTRVYSLIRAIRMYSLRPPKLQRETSDLDENPTIKVSG